MSAAGTDEANGLVRANRKGYRVGATGADRYIRSRMICTCECIATAVNLGGTADFIRPERFSFGAFVFWRYYDSDFTERAMATFAA